MTFKLLPSVEFCQYIFRHEETQELLQILNPHRIPCISTLLHKRFPGQPWIRVIWLSFTVLREIAMRRLENTHFGTQFG